jgi:hypothetical protein
MEVNQPLYGAGPSDRPSAAYYETKLKSCQSKTLEDGGTEKKNANCKVNVKKKDTCSIYDSTNA